VKRYLITGGAGTIGSALTKKLLKDGNQVCVFDNSEDALFRLKQQLHEYENVRFFVGDVRDVTRLNMAMNGVDIVFHAAALKHVELSEYNVLEAISINVDGTKNIVTSCLNSPSVKKAIFTSSDKAVNPTSTMGTTKLMGEKIFTSSNNLVGNRDLHFSSVRFGNVLKSNGSVLKIFKEALENNKPYPITDIRMTRFFLTLEESINLCEYAALNSIGGEIFVRSMGAASILSLAKAFNKSEDIRYKEIGSKPGEKLYEELVTEIESMRTVFLDGHYIILPEDSTIEKKSLIDSLNNKYINQVKTNSPLDSRQETLDWVQLQNIISSS